MITDDELRQYEEGDLIDVTVIDEEGVLPEARGKTFRCRVKSIGPDRLSRTEFEGTIMMHATPEGEQVLNRHVDTYSFHSHLIEKIEPVNA